MNHRRVLIDLKYRPHPDAKDVHVTGTFDDWGKTEQLNKVGDFFEKEVNLPSADEKIYYKFVVDDVWIIDPTAPQEDDGSHNINNVLLPKDIKKHTGMYNSPHTRVGEILTNPIASSAAPVAAAAGAGAVGAGAVGAVAAGAGTTSEPLERKMSPPGGFPETPSEEKEQSFGVAPIPASSGIGNPINLPAGEKVPEHSAVTDHTVDSTATTSKEGYERDASAALPAAAGLAGAGGLAATAASAFSKPEDKQNLIPESSLPMGGDVKDTMDSGPHIQSAAPTSSTAALAAGVPLEKKRQAMVIDPADAPQTNVETASGVPETVKESISEAHQPPEAAGSAEAVKEKSAMEQELLKKTTTSEGTGDAGITPETQTSYYGLATEVPPTVEKSMQEAHAAPEAAAEPSVVAEKSAMESELLKNVPSSEAAGEPAPTIAAATSESVPSTTIDNPAASSGLSTGEKIAGGAVGGTAVAGVVAATGSTFGGGGAFHTDPVGTITKNDSIAKPEAVEHFKDDPTHAAQSTGATTVEDPALADEPAVKMMQQEAGDGDIGTGGTFAHGATTTTASTGEEAATSVPAASTEPAAPVPTGSSKEAETSAATGTTTTPSASSTPIKRTAAADNATSSPTSSANTKEKKKRNRLSRLFHKIVD